MQSQQRAAAKAIRDVRAILGLVSMGFDPQAAQAALHAQPALQRAARIMDEAIERWPDDLDAAVGMQRYQLRALVGLLEEAAWHLAAGETAPESASDIVAGLAVASELADEIAAVIADGAHDCRCL